jgi:sulfate permease, SulP family
VPGAYSDLTRHPENLPVPGVLIVRLDGPLYYANARTVCDRVKALVEEAQPLPYAVILDAAAQDEIDLTGSDTLTSLIKDLHARNIAVVVAELHLPVREFSRRTGLLQLIGEDNVFYTVEAAVRAIEKNSHEIS